MPAKSEPSRRRAAIAVSEDRPVEADRPRRARLHRREPDDGPQRQPREQHAEQPCRRRRPARFPSAIGAASLARLAPSAPRSANSRSRSAPRTSMRLATLAHAMSRTSTTAPSMTMSAGRTLRVRCVSSGSTPTVVVAFVRGCSFASLRRDRVELGLRRPRGHAIAQPCRSRPTSQRRGSGVSQSSEKTFGTKTSRRSRPSNRFNSASGGRTPTTVNGSPSSESTVPRPSGRSPSRCQNAWLMTATRSCAER